MHLNPQQRAVSCLFGGFIKSSMDLEAQSHMTWGFYFPNCGLKAILVFTFEPNKLFTQTTDVLFKSRALISATVI